MFNYDSKEVNKNIEQVWEQYTSEDFNNGKMWYREANQFSLEVAEKFQVTPVVSAGVLSALSPLKEWELNKRITENFFTLMHKDAVNGWKRVGHWLTQKKKAWDIYTQNPIPEQVSKILGGLKTVNFFGCINNPSDTESLCVDRHMIKIATQSDNAKITKKQYLFLKQEYLNFANRVDMIPSHAQAILWVTHKRIKNI